MNKLTYNTSARNWREALPIGNGHTSVMIYGGKTDETLCFNDVTLWSGYPKDYNSHKSLKNLDEVRRLIFNGENRKADILAQNKLRGYYSETFLPLGTVKIDFKGVKNGEYKRNLDLSAAVHTVQNGWLFREAFASNPDRIICYHIENNSEFSVTVSANSKLRSSVSADNGLNLTGNAPDYAAPNYLMGEIYPIRYNKRKGMAFALRCVADTDGEICCVKKRMEIKNAGYVNLYFATATGFNGFDKMPETSRKKTLEKCKKYLDFNKDYEEIKQRHTADFKALFEKSQISFYQETDINTDELLKKAKTDGVSPALAEIFYNYGKYMIASGSRQGGQPLNLQGQWNNSIRPPWSSNYTVNINTEMNYWGASRANLGECVEPLLQMVYEVMQNGRKTARINYGCGGFACNHNVDIWRKTTPVRGGCNFMLEPLCGVWLANEVYAHYKNGALSNYEEKVSEIVKEAAQFSADYLVLHNGEYVICPSPSAENIFKHNGSTCSLDYASAFDMGLVKQAFSNYLDLSGNGELYDKIQNILPKLFDFKFGQNGILEFHKDYEMPERGHRHFSPLYAFYPANVIKYYENEKQTAEVRKLFYDRISHSTQHIGWSAAWGICLSARLHDKENAKDIMQKFLSNAVFKNLFCVHPPYYFQIDGNLGFVSAVHEMLVYEENGVIELLPALPDNLLNGCVKNLLVNGAELSFEWRDGKVISVSSDKKVEITDANLSGDLQLNDCVSVKKL